ncbi:amino acid ABC transporter ATP-binding/permease protein [Thiopseudomonas alkaliphila]|uniref:amino acid ABC transporter ATP-binding/permease protein n=1 Tax=Thiopseudomonas alkaliphila TaxID=1697053 RepID=UPI0035713E24
MNQPIALSRLLKSRFENWLIALLLGALTLFSAIALLAVSGWFITASAIAGLSVTSAYLFDYFRPAAMIRFFAITRTAGRYAERVTSHNAALGLLKDLRCQVFAWLTRKPVSFARQTEVNSAQQMHRLVADIDRLDHFPLQVISPWCWASVIVFAFLIFAAWVHPTLLWASLVGVLLAWLIIPLAAAYRGLQLARRDVETAERRRMLMLESLQLVTPLTMWQNWQVQQQQALQADADYQQQQLRQQRLISLTRLWQQWALASSMLVVLWLGLPLVEQQLISLPWLLAPVLALFGLNEALLPLAASFISLGESQAARDRLNRLYTPILQPQAEVKVANKADADVSLMVTELSAKHQAAVSGPTAVSFNLQQGQALLVTGASGVGKSTLLQALAGYLPYTGTVQASHPIAYLSQQLDIFDLSLAENLRLANAAASDEQLWAVLEQVALADWARQQQGLATQLGEYGAQVSGGQARRIALARVLLSERPILLLDEPLAGLDAQSASVIEASLAAYQAQAVIVVVSHQAITLPQLQTLVLR